MFNHHDEATPHIEAVKLTKENIHDVAQKMTKDGHTVKVSKDTLEVWGIGDWIIRGYDYSNNTYRYRTATTADRERFDLR